MRWISIVYIIFLGTGGIAQQEDLRDEIRKIIMYDTEIDWGKTPEMVIALIDGDSTYHFTFSGFSSKSPTTLNEGSVFEVGSISKVFTASLISVLETNALINTDLSINHYLLEEWQNPRLQDLTINDLLSHYSYFPKRPEGFGRYEKDPRNPYAHYSKESLLEYFKEYVPKEEKTFKYSHTNYALLEIVIENVTQLNYENALWKYITGPLDLQNTYIHESERHLNDIADGHDRSMRKVSPWAFRSFEGSEGLKSSASDLVQYLRANMQMSNTHLDNVLFKNHRIERQTSINEQIYIGKAWHILDHGKRYDIVMHSGKTSGHHAYIGYIPETLTGVVVLSNSSYGSQDLGFLILRMLNFNWKRKDQ